VLAAAAAAAVAVESATETAAVAVVVLVDLWCCRMERGSTGLDSFYGRKKTSPLKRGWQSSRGEKRSVRHTTKEYHPKAEFWRARLADDERLPASDTRIAH
jgi:hypothetical protein